MKIIDKINVPVLVVQLERIQCPIKVVVQKLNRAARELLGEELKSGVDFSQFLADPACQKFFSLFNTSEIISETVQLYNFHHKSIHEVLLSVEPYGKNQFVITATPLQTFQSRELFHAVLKDIIETTALGISIYENGQLIYVNPALSDITGYSREELIQAGSFSYFAAQEHKPQIETIAKNLPAQREPVEFWILTKDCKRKYLKAYFYYLPKTSHFSIVAFHNITEHKQVIVDLESRTIEFKTLADNVPEFLLRFNRDFRCTYANPAVFPITGLYPKDFIGKDIQTLGFDDETLYLLKKAFIECFAERKKRVLEYVYNTKYGTRTIETTMVPEINQETNVVQSILTISRDITSLKLMIDKISKSEEHYRLLANNSTDIIWTMNLKRELIYVSPSVERVLGFKPEEFNNRIFENSFTSESLENFQLTVNQIIKHIKLGEYSKIAKDYRLEVQQYHKSGTLLYIEIILNAQIDSFGKYIGIIGLSRDISERKQAELELIATREKALEADRLKTAFLANMSHEIRTPMNGIIGFVDLLTMEDITPEQRKEYLELINTNTNQLLKLIDDIIDISRIESGQLPINKRPVNVIPLIDNVIKTSREKIKQFGGKNVELIYSPDRTELILDVDPVRFTQIVSNLVCNSIKFTEAGEISVSYNFSKSEVLFTVSDTGIGIASDKIVYIFDRFRQADQFTSRKYGGAGLGLSIAKNLVEAMGGRIWVESEEGKGTKFYFSLPLHTEEISAEVIEEPTQIQMPSITELEIRNILVVEDEEMNFALIRETLKNEPYRIIWAHDGEEAIKAMNEEVVHLVLMDIRLPKMNGYEATRNIKKLFPTVPIIAQTAYSNYEDVVTALESGCDDFIAKPIKPKKLKSLIEKYLVEKNQLDN